jgi:CheY-like chemotaxis protein
MWLLREIRSLGSVPVIAVTGRTLPQERQALTDAGFNALIIKPIDDWDGLAEIILAAIGRP